MSAVSILGQEFADYIQVHFVLTQNKIHSSNKKKDLRVKAAVHNCKQTTVIIKAFNVINVILLERITMVPRDLSYYEIVRT